MAACWNCFSWSVSYIPKSRSPFILLRSTRSFQLQVKVWCWPCKGLYPSAWRGETSVRPWEGTEAPEGKQSANICIIFSAGRQYLILFICFVSTQFVAFVLLGWEMVVWDLEHICVPEWSQSMLAWREMCYCFLLWHCCCWLKGACCALLLKLQESSIERPTALGGG